MALLVLSGGTAAVRAARPDAPAAATASACPGDGFQTLERTISLSLTPDTPGEVTATVRFDAPANLEDLTVSPATRGTVVSASGFVRTSRGFSWDGETETPTLRLTVPANRSTSRSEEFVRGGYTFVDVGSWALVPVPRFSTEWAWSGEPVHFDGRVRVDGDGVAGTSMAYLGPSRTFSRTAHGQRFSLVVPRAASLRADPAAVLDALAGASDRLHTGDRDPQVFVYAMPSSVDWGVRGLSVGDADAWVVASAPVADVDNVWIHEYVHTRQRFPTTAATTWVVEGTANYYAALVAYEEGLVDYDAFRRFLEFGDEYPYGDAVLSRPDSWASARVPYRKGALVAGALDRRIRAATGGSATLGDVLDAMNGRSRPVSGAGFLSIVAAVADEETGQFAARYVDTGAAPDTWDRAAHRRAFDAVARTTVSFPQDARYRVTGPYRNVTTDRPPRLATGETLTVPVTVENAGEVAGRYNATLLSDETAVAHRTGTVGPGATETVELRHAFDAPGRYRLSNGWESFPVTVCSPVEAAVQSVAVSSETVAPGETVTVSVTVANDASFPARTALRVADGGTTLFDGDVALGPGETKTVRRTVTFTDPGTHVVTAANRSVRVRVRVREETSAPGQAGVGPAVAALALLAGTVLAGALGGRPT